MVATLEGIEVEMVNHTVFIITNYALEISQPGI
jgi:hypothetical protein